MDVIGPDVLIPVAAAFAGLLLGILLGRTSRRQRALVEELEVRVAEREGQIVQLGAARADLETRLAKSELEREEVSEKLTRYRNEVTAHFSQTSDLLKDMTLQYRNIYQHLSQGAEALCPEGTLRLETSAPIDALAAELGVDGPHEPEDDTDDGSSMDAAHTDTPVQVDPRPEL